VTAARLDLSAPATISAEGSAPADSLQLPDGCVAASSGDRSVRLAIGQDSYGSTLDPRSIWPLYCASKPLVAAAVLALEHQGELDLDAPVGDLVPWRTSHYVASLTPLDILEHRTQLPVISGLTAVMLSDEDRWNTVFRARAMPVVPNSSRYDVFSGYWLLGTIVASVTGLPLAASIRALVTDPLEIDDLGYFDSEEEYHDVAARIAVPAYRSTVDPDVLLAATGASSSVVATRPNAAFGAYGTVPALAAFTRHLAAEALGGARPRLLSDRFAARLGSAYDDAGFDETLQRVSQFRCGLEVDVGAHGFGRTLTDRAFGHGSEGGGITIVVDPDSELTVVAAHTVLETDPAAMRARREGVVDSLAAATRAAAPARR
jgi:CubicO group peptidase (beta-lactamase class C family)